MLSLVPRQGQHGCPMTSSSINGQQLLTHMAIDLPRRRHINATCALPALQTQHNWCLGPSGLNGAQPHHACMRCAVALTIGIAPSMTCCCAPFALSRPPHIAAMRGAHHRLINMTTQPRQLHILTTPAAQHCDISATQCSVVSGTLPPHQRHCQLHISSHIGQAAQPGTGCTVTRHVSTASSRFSTPSCLCRRPPHRRHISATRAQQLNPAGPARRVVACTAGSCLSTLSRQHHISCTSAPHQPNGSARQGLHGDSVECTAAGSCFSTQSCFCRHVSTTSQPNQLHISATSTWQLSPGGPARRLH